MSAIIIATVLLLVATTGGLTGIFARGDALDAELKARSVGAADGCVDQALLSMANGEDPNGDSYTLNTLDKCTISNYAVVGSVATFNVRAISSNAATTNLEVKVNTTNLSIISWREIATF